MNIQEILSRDLQAAEYLLLKVYVNLPDISCVEDNSETIRRELMSNIKAYFDMALSMNGMNGGDDFEIQD